LSPHTLTPTPPQEPKNKKEKMKEDKIVDDTEKPDFEPTLIPLPVFNPVSSPVPKEPKHKTPKMPKEDKIVDDTEKKEVRGKCCWLGVWVCTRAACRVNIEAAAVPATAAGAVVVQLQDTVR
jgi:hypothetical protein